MRPSRAWNWWRHLSLRRCSLVPVGKGHGAGSMAESGRGSATMIRRGHILAGLGAAVLLMLALCGCHGSLDAPKAEIAATVAAVRTQAGATLRADALFEAVGSEPHKTVELGDKLYWYFYGTDGKVIVTVDAAAYEERGLAVFKAGIRQVD